METTVERQPILRMSPQGVNELFTALSKAQGEMGHAHKSADNPFFKSKYADLAECIDAARPHLAAHELCVVQAPALSDGYVDVEMLLGHSSGQWIACNVGALPKDSGPQSIGSVITYLRRYTYQAMTGLAADDDDGNSGQGLAEKQAAPSHAATRDATAKRLQKKADDAKAAAKKAPPQAGDETEKPKDAASAYSTAMARVINFQGTDEQFGEFKTKFFDWLTKASMDNSVTDDQAKALTAALGKVEDGREASKAAA